MLRPTGMDIDEDWIDRQALIDADPDPDDPQVWADQRWVRQLLRRYGDLLRSQGQ
ncbi:hypothetical protein [Nocardia stercoris]|uniref:hypothetical protein n=1 Tax=Nocardia stercoris TaxID=2483361 RepID=UPI001319E3C8|nr:hypothetical protein [Nocardia stercoris]